MAETNIVYMHAILIGGRVHSVYESHEAAAGTAVLVIPRGTKYEITLVGIILPVKSKKVKDV